MNVRVREDITSCVDELPRGEDHAQEWSRVREGEDEGVLSLGGLSPSPGGHSLRGSWVSSWPTREVRVSALRPGVWWRDVAVSETSQAPRGNTGS